MAPKLLVQFFEFIENLLFLFNVHSLNLLILEPQQRPGKDPVESVCLDDRRQSRLVEQGKLMLMSLEDGIGHVHRDKWNLTVLNWSSQCRNVIFECALNFLYFCQQRSLEPCSAPPVHIGKPCQKAGNLPTAGQFQSEDQPISTIQARLVLPVLLGESQQRDAHQRAEASGREQPARRLGGSVRTLRRPLFDEVPCFQITWRDMHPLPMS